jgi:hypothetical protein
LAITLWLTFRPTLVLCGWLMPQSVWSVAAAALVCVVAAAFAWVAARASVTWRK